MIENNCWIYEGKCLEVPPEGYYGYIYVIIDDQGKPYWGKKAFLHSTRKTLSKRARVASGTRKRIEKGTKDSQWINYWGSSKPLLEYIATRGGTDGFQRHILRLCKDKASLSYYEIVYMINNNVLFRDDCWNGNIAGRYFKGKIHE